MKILVTDLLKNNQLHKEVEFEERYEEIKVNGDIIKFLEPVKLKGILSFEDNTFKLKGNLELKLELICHRCSKSFNQEFIIDIDENYSSEEKASDDFYRFNGDEIDLTPMVQDNIFINMPLKLLCIQDCKGLCEICGCNKNEEECDCVPNQYDSRLEKLLKYKS